MKRAPKKPCPHATTRLPATVGKRTLALCCSCERLVDVTPKTEAKRG